MHVSAALLVILQLLLRGAAVPHEHEMPVGTTGHAHRAHAHFVWDSEGHSHDHHDSDQADHDLAFPHDCDAVYVDVSPMMGTATLQGFVEDTAVEWGLRSDRNASVSPVLLAGRFVGRRPPGDAADPLHTFLPHVLRI